jgi:hypothetical protein
MPAMTPYKEYLDARLFAESSKVGLIDYSDLSSSSRFLCPIAAAVSKPPPILRQSHCHPNSQSPKDRDSTNETKRALFVRCLPQPAFADHIHHPGLLSSYSQPATATTRPAPNRESGVQQGQREE